ncbi:MAG: hypothetical protein L3J71_16700 [Victivallaceae bacterium]|nr:hypothetical protein [Victivallaceae bacterium]
MRKKIMLFVVCATTLIFNINAGGKLLDYVPAGIDGVVSISIKQIMDIPVFKEKRTTDPELKKQWAEFENLLKNYGLTVNDLPNQALIFFSQDQKLNGAVLKTSLNEKRFVEILKKEQRKQPSLYTTRKLNGNTVYVLDDNLLPKSQLSKIQGGKVPALTFLESDIAIICEDNMLDTVVGAIKNNGATVKRLLGKSADVDRNAPIWLVFRNNSPAVAPQPGQRPGMMDGITGVGLSLDFTGAKKRDLGLNAQISCRDANAAAGMGMQLQGMVMMMSAMAFKDNPQLGGEVGQAVKVKANGSSVAINISVPEQLGEKLQKYIAEQKNRPKKQRKLRSSKK